MSRTQSFFADCQDAQIDRLGSIEARLGEISLSQSIESGRMLQARLAESSLALRHITLGEREGVGVFAGELELTDLSV